MANEIDKTIEELEAEVVAELEEGNGADAPKKRVIHIGARFLLQIAGFTH
jgi:hypothetical protein